MHADVQGAVDIKNKIIGVEAKRLPIKLKPNPLEHSFVKYAMNCSYINKPMVWKMC